MEFSVSNIGERQKAIIDLLHQEKEGLTIDQFSSRLDISRNAVCQHITVLERDGYIYLAKKRKTAGRPGHIYVLTEAGEELFPRKYSWFSTILLKSLKDQLGSQQLARYLRAIAGSVAEEVESRVKGKSGLERIDILVQILNEFGYDAQKTKDLEQPEITATNCIYHQLVEEFSEVCEFDLELMEKITNHKVDHIECMVRGGKKCRFTLHPTPN